MLIVLPPSETKASGGHGPALSPDELSFSELNDTRIGIARDLAALDVDAALEVLGISESLRAEAEANQDLWTSPTMPALYRYTGVLYDALEPTTLPAQAWQHLAIASALFGLVMAADPIPHYRLSGGTKLPVSHDSASSQAPATPTMKKRWGTSISKALSNSEELVIDLRSSTYQQLGRVPAVTVRVESEREDGSRTVVSHFNKHYKGQLARILALAAADGASPRDAEEVAEIARAGGMVVEGPVAKAKNQELTVVV